MGIHRKIISLIALAPLAASCALHADLDEQRSEGAVRQAIINTTADGELSADDIDLLFEATGPAVSAAEMRLIRDATESSDFTVLPQAIDRARALARVTDLLDYEVDFLTANSSASYLWGPDRIYDPAYPHLTGTDQGIEIPEAVVELVSRARLNGAIAFDIRETDSDGEGIWNPYPSSAPPLFNMAFDYTRITPEVLAADRDDTAVTYNAIVGTETAEECGADGCYEYERVRYQQRTGGTGHIKAHYDHAYHPDLYARGRDGQKWASNCAFLSDGTLHCLPAARRSMLRDLILTNPHLSRCTDLTPDDQAFFEDSCHTLLYMGHITADAGVITSVEISGRLSRRIALGRATIVDPLTLLEAWGFDIRPDLRIRYGNTSEGVPVRNLDRGIIESATGVP